MQNRRRMSWHPTWHTDLETYIQRVQPTETSWTTRKQVQQRMETLVQSIYPQARVVLVGSTASLVFTDECDMNVCILFPFEVVPSTIVQSLSTWFAKNNSSSSFRVLRCVTEASIPVLSCQDEQTCCKVDVVVQHTLATQHASLVRALAECDTRVCALLWLVKQWTRARKLDQPRYQTLSSYAYTILLFAYLQRVEPPVLPPLVERSLAVPVLAGHDSSSSSCSSNQDSIAQLWYGFFCTYATKEAWTTEHRLLVVPSDSEGNERSSRTFGSFSSSSSSSSVYHSKRSSDGGFVIVDPVRNNEPSSSNLASSCTVRSIRLLQREFARAADLLSLYKPSLHVLWSPRPLFHAPPIPHLPDPNLLRTHGFVAPTIVFQHTRSRTNKSHAATNS